MIKDLVKVANRLDALGLTKEADIIDSIIRVASSNKTPEDLIKDYKSKEGQRIWIGLNLEADFYDMAKNSPEANELKSLHFSDLNTDDFKKVISGVNGRDAFADSFGESEAERIGNLLGYTELESGVTLTQEQILKLLAGHFDKGTPYTMSKSLLDKITSVGLTTSDLEEADMKYLRYSA